MELRRREFATLMLGGAAALSLAGRAHAEGDPLRSWNAGPAKDAIVKFVHATTDAASPNFVPVADRIATFDQDGTLWVEHPIYTQLVYCFDRVAVVAKAKPELVSEEPFKTVLSGDREAIANLSIDDLFKIVGVTLSGMDVDTFRDKVAKWIAEGRDPRWKRPYTDLVYQPQIELLKYLRSVGYRTYIVTGGGQDFVRAYAERVYGVPPEQVIGAAGGLTYHYAPDGKPQLIKEPKRSSSTIISPASQRAFTS
jgi:phosphoglycolate phosphatase-like HAD superfamily hydrolase